MPLNARTSMERRAESADREMTSEREILPIGPYRFDPGSGELWLADGGDEPIRLKPQPARLLTLLIEKDGALLSREEIREGVWPDVEIEFDQSLHFCVHQLRTALRGTTIPIETLPRRGYRLKPPPDSRNSPDSAAESTVAGSGKTRTAARPWQMALFVLLLLVVTGTIALRTARRGSEPSDPGQTRAPRLAVLPFRPDAGVPVLGEPWQVAERVLLDLGNLGPDVVTVVGPATTGRYGSDFPSLGRMLDEIELDFILNGRFIDPGEASEPWPLLVEVIRTSDGAHLWVVRYADCSDPETIAQEVLTALRRELRLPESS